MEQDRKMIMRNIIAHDRASGQKNEPFTRSLNRALATAFQRYNNLSVSEIERLYEEKGIAHECHDGLIANFHME